MNEWRTYTRGTDKSLARPGRKQARKHVRDARDFNNIETRAVIKFFSPLQCKAPKEIHAILTEILASFLRGRAKDLSAPLYVYIFCRHISVISGSWPWRRHFKHKYTTGHWWVQDVAMDKLPKLSTSGFLCHLLFYRECLSFPTKLCAHFWDPVWINAPSVSLSCSQPHSLLLTVLTRGPFQGLTGTQWAPRI